MPYSADSNNLPANVKNLPEGLRNLWVRAWNSAFQRTKDEGQAFRIANKMLASAKKSSEGELDEDWSDDRLEQYVDAESEERPSRNYLTRLRDMLKGLKGKPMDDGMIDHIMRSSAGSAGARRRMQNRKTSEITDFRLLYAMSEPPSAINVLPVPGTYKHPAYGNIRITKERNARFVDNFTKQVYQDRLPIDAEHDTKLSGAFGWITSLMQQSDGSVDAQVAWTDRGTQAIESDRFKYFSPEWYDEWVDPATGKSYQDVLIGGAVTTRPFFKDPALKPLVASELVPTSSEDEEYYDETFAEIDDLLERMTQEQKKSLTSQARSILDSSNKPPEVTKMTNSFAETPEYKSMSEKINALETQLTEAKTESDARKTAAEAAEAKVTAAEGRIDQLEGSLRKQRFTALVKAPHRWYGDADKHVARLEKMAAAFGEESEEFKDYVSEQAAQAEQLAASEVFKEQGHSAPVQGASEFQAALKTHREAHPEQSEAQAVDAVLKASPKFYTDYQKAMREAQTKGHQGIVTI